MIDNRKPGWLGVVGTITGAITIVLISAILIVVLSIILVLLVNFLGDLVEGF